MLQEMTAVGLNNWGMVQQYMMQKELDEHIVSGSSKAIIEHKVKLLAIDTCIVSCMPWGIVTASAVAA